jgi:hypothetical protein
VENEHGSHGEEHISREREREREAAEWIIWKEALKFFLSRLLWWSRYVKRKIKNLCISVGTEHNRYRRNLENFYYSAIHSHLKEECGSAKRLTKLNELKAKILRLHRQESQKRFLDVGEDDHVVMHVSLHHIIRARKRQSMRMFTAIVDGNGLQYTKKDILETFFQHLRSKYEEKEVDTCEVKKTNM